MKKDISNILNILKDAIKAEQNAYLDYVNASKMINIPELKGILIYLAEEERKHRILLLREYNILKKGINEIVKHKIKFKIPKNYNSRTLQTIPGIDVQGISLPMEIIGGDYFDTFSIIDEKKELSKLGIILYDAMGHGLSATYIKSITRKIFHELREYYFLKNAFKVFNPSYVVTEINKVIAKECIKKGAFVTLFYCIIDPKKGELIYTSAGHEPPILISKNIDIVEQMTTTQLLLGFDENTRYEESKIRINPDDIFVLFSDGIIEAEDSNGTMFGRENIIEAVLKNRNNTPSEILDAIVESFKNHIGRKFVHDEISLFVAKINNKQFRRIF